MSATVAEPTPAARAALHRRALERKRARSHPAGLLQHVSCVDTTTGDTFQFQLLDSADGWFWQRGLLDEWLAAEKHISLKARQVGITWLAGGLALWTLLYTPGSKVLAVSIKEEEAVKLVNRVWDMLHSLPAHLWDRARVIKPLRTRPTAEIQLQFPDGRISSIRGLTSTPTAGHGETAALVILDEFSRQPYAAETWKAVLPTTQGGGRTLVISTGNGVSNDRGGGNFFHHLWVNAEGYGLAKAFLPWHLHPDRDEDWYQVHARALSPADRGEQYPRSELEAFILTGKPYFDLEALAHYEGHVCIPLFRFDFATVNRRHARLARSEHGRIRIYQEPEPQAAYAVGVDVATGRGQDFSAACVVRLDTMAVVCELHGKLDADEYAQQLHYLGRLYNSALIAVESAGGFGEAVTIALRDGKDGRPPYPRLYRHVLSSRPDRPTVKPFGYPINSKTRPLVINQLEKALRDRALPWIGERLLAECRTFVHADTNPSPRAQEGCNDDMVFATAIALEMYRLYGAHPHVTRHLLSRRDHAYPWQGAKRARPFDLARYPA